VNDVAGTTVTLTDTDDDGVPDFRDWDSDGDGFGDDTENGDFDGNGIMDYLENQNDGELDTAIRGSGGAIGMELILLATFFGWAAWRRRRFGRVSMTLAALIVLTPTLLVGMPAHADTKCHKQMANEADVFQDCWYLQGGFIGTHVDPENTVNGWRTTDNSSDGWKVSIGWHFKPRWFAELAYADLGEAGLSNLNPAIEALVPRAEIEYAVPSLMAGYWFREPESRWNTYLKGGAGRIENDSSDSRIGYDKQTPIQFVFGLGFQYQRKDSGWFVRAEFDSYDRDAWAYGVSIGRYFEPSND